MARTVTGMVQTVTRGTAQTVTRGMAQARKNDTSALPSDVAQAICYGSSPGRGTGSRPSTGGRGLGLTAALDEAVRAALPELRESVKAAVDRTLLRLLAMVVALLAAGWACAVGRPRAAAVALVRRVYAWVHQRDLRFK